MRTHLLIIVAGGLGAAPSAGISEPLQLIPAQMDQITAGNGTFVSAVAAESASTPGSTNNEASASAVATASASTTDGTSTSEASASAVAVASASTTDSTSTAEASVSDGTTAMAVGTPHPWFEVLPGLISQREDLN